MGHKSTTFSSENLTKAIHRLPLHLTNQFYKFKGWKCKFTLDDHIKVCFNPLADIVNKQDLSNKSKLPLPKSYSNLTNSLDISDEIQDEKDQGCKSNSNSTVNSSNKTAESVGFKR